MTPIDIADTGGMPRRWKKRTLTPTRAAVDGMARLTKVMANCSSATGPNGIAHGHAARVDSAWGSRGSWPQRERPAGSEVMLG